MLLQRLALLFDVFQSQCGGQLFLQLSLLLLQLLLQFAQFRQGPLLILCRQGFQPQLQARQIELPGIRIDQGRKQGLAIKAEIFVAQGQYRLGQHLVQRVELFRRDDTGQLLIEVLPLGAQLLRQLRGFPFNPCQLALDGRWRAALCLADPYHQRIPLFLQLAAARLQQGAVGDQGKTLLQRAQLFALLVKLLLFQLALILLACGLHILFAQAG